MKRILSLVILLFAIALLIIGTMTRTNLFTDTGLFSKLNIVISVVVLCIVFGVGGFISRDNKNDEPKN